MRIAIFGGSFNPPHLGHLQVAEELLKNNLADEIWFVPVGNHAFAKQLAPTNDRLVMLKLMIESSAKREHFKICDYEINLKTVSYTNQTLRHFQKKYPGDEFIFVMGSDQLASFDKWQDYQELAKDFAVLVYPRCLTSDCDLNKQQQLANKYQLKFLNNFPTIMISSTQVRNIHHEQTLNSLVTPAVANYIEQHQLYAN